MSVVCVFVCVCVCVCVCVGVCRTVFSRTEHRRPGMSLCALKPPNDFAWGCAHTDVVQCIKRAADRAVKALPR